MYGTVNILVSFCSAVSLYSLHPCHPCLSQSLSLAHCHYLPQLSCHLQNCIHCHFQCEHQNQFTQPWYSQPGPQCYDPFEKHQSLPTVARFVLLYTGCSQLHLSPGLLDFVSLRSNHTASSYNHVCMSIL